MPSLYDVCKVGERAAIHACREPRGAQECHTPVVGPYYIVTDLTIRSRFEPKVLDKELRQAGLHGGLRFYNGVWTAIYSSSNSCGRRPAGALDEQLQIVETLSGSAREQWDSCTARKFDMGFQCCNGHFYSTWKISSRLLRRLAAVNGDIVVTIYRTDASACYEESDPN